MSQKKNRPKREPASEVVKRIPKITAGHLLPIAILALVSLVVYFNSLTNGFVYDDYATIIENKHIQHPGKSLPSLFSRSYFNIASGEASYRPVATLSYYLIYAIGELNATYYHLFSVLLHALNVILVYLLANKIIKNRYTALIAGLLFACHPALTEAVDAISYNEDLLTAFFFFLALIIYADITSADVKPRIKAYILSLFSFLLALLSKEMAITLPAVIFLYDLVMRDADGRSFSLKALLRTIKDRIYFYAGYLAVGLFYLYLRFGVFYHPGESIKPVYGSLIERIIYLPAHIYSFIKLAVFPANLNADYVFAYPGGLFEMNNLIGLAAVSGLVGAGFVIYKKSKAHPAAVSPTGASAALIRNWGAWMRPSKNTKEPSPSIRMTTRPITTLVLFMISRASLTQPSKAISDPFRQTRPIPMLTLTSASSIRSRG